MRIIRFCPEGEMEGVANVWLEIDDEGEGEPPADDLD
jgi:hypothetical protein